MEDTISNRRGRKPSPEPHVCVTTIKGSSRWAEWLKRLAEHDRNTLIGLIDRSVTEYARNHGFQDPPPKR